MNCGARIGYLLEADVFTGAGSHGNLLLRTGVACIAQLAFQVFACRLTPLVCIDVVVCCCVSGANAHGDNSSPSWSQWYIPIARIDSACK